MVADFFLSTSALLSGLWIIGGKFTGSVGSIWAILIRPTPLIMHLEKLTAPCVGFSVMMVVESPANEPSVRGVCLCGWRCEKPLLIRPASHVSFRAALRDSELPYQQAVKLGIFSQYPSNCSCRFLCRDAIEGVGVICAIGQLNLNTPTA